MRKRTCTELNDCGTKKFYPEVIMPCEIKIDYCSNGIKDNDEKYIDCGGYCSPCVEAQNDKEESKEETLSGITGMAVSNSPY